MADLFNDKNISPMLLNENKEPFDDTNYIFELKLDGIRSLAYIDNGAVVLQNKRFKDVTTTYPELQNIHKSVKGRCILDGELVCLTDGKPDFYSLQKRSLMTDDFKITFASKRNAVQFVAYDILYLNGTDLTKLSLTERKKKLSATVIEGNNLSVSRFIETTGIAFFELAKSQDLEGIVAKRKDSIYKIGKRTNDWIKIKFMQDEDLIVCGYQPDDNGQVKDLILGYYDKSGKMQCRGKVYLGVSEHDKKTIQNFALKNSVTEAWFDRYKHVIWLKAELVGTAHFMHVTSSGQMRQPVFKGLRDDKSAEECRNLK